MAIAALGVAAAIMIAEVRDGPGVAASEIRMRELSEPIATPRGREVELYRGANWRVARHVPSGHLSVHAMIPGTDGFVDRPLPTDWRRHAHPMAAVEDEAGDLFLVIYDTLESSPSGRRLDAVTNRFDVHRFTTDASVPGPDRLATGIAFVGLDAQIYATMGRRGLHLCGDNRCLSVDRSGSVRPWALDALAPFEFVEVAFRDDRAAAIIRRRHDDRTDGAIGTEAATYLTATFDADGNVRMAPVPGGLPYALRFATDRPTVELASTPDELRRVLYHDLGRLGFGGVLDLGANNLEGRVAWSQAYYLNGLVSLLTPALAWLRPENEATLRGRLRMEIELLLALCATDYPGLRVKRYSLEREPLLFALHLGRTLHLIQRARSVLPDLAAAACVGRLSHQLDALDLTVEERGVSVRGDGRERPVLRYRRGQPFWADGANVPHNYVSGVAGGLALLGDEGRATARHLMGHLLDDVFAGPPPTLWRYWSGDGDRGWEPESGLSLNTPRYAGNGGSLAHVTYRTMDATALVLIADPDDGADDRVPPPLIDWIRDLTRRGWLLPSMNEVFAATGEAVRLDGSVARRYARSAAIWELQSQVWALHALAHHDP